MSQLCPCNLDPQLFRQALPNLSRQTIMRWGFDPEILFLARRLGFSVKEVPVVWAHSEGTRLNPFRDGIRMFGEVLRVRWNSVLGAYTTPAVSSPGKV